MSSVNPLTCLLGGISEIGFLSGHRHIFAEPVREQCLLMRCEPVPVFLRAFTDSAVLFDLDWIGNFADGDFRIPHSTSLLIHSTELYHAARRTARMSLLRWTRAMTYGPG